MKSFDILTIFPEVCTPYLETSILGRAQEKKLVRIAAHNLRDWSPDKKHKKVDDKPFGGGPGMVMGIQAFDQALKKLKRKNARVILTSASGKRFTQADAKRLAKYDQLIFLCGRYEGVDHRVEKHLADEALSIGDYVLTGGELPALAMIDAITRLIPGVLGKEASLTMESHDTPGVLEYPQYTRPEVYPFKKDRKIKKLRVPTVLLSGHHEKITHWRQKQTKGHTRNV
ncbi:tRNA (guanosine(37)-N1)-methyltransferase TrmD [Candidatus Uhrbacteria bacterium]|nr:tRNA (guanosine(37)-N1)-methyltransferase TrmD [Candidatus Uhrbacteria bacterium]